MLANGRDNKLAHLFEVVACPGVRGERSESDLAACFGFALAVRALRGRSVRCGTQPATAGDRERALHAAWKAFGEHNKTRTVRGV